MAWSAPIAAVAYAAPAFAASQPVVVTDCGTACKHPGGDKWYHFTFCFKTNTDLDGGLVYLDTIRINKGDGTGATRDVVQPLTVAVATGSTVCKYVDAAGFPNSMNGKATLAFHYFIGGVRTDATFQTGELSLPPCGTEADPGNNPKTTDHTPEGSGTIVPINCTV